MAFNTGDCLIEVGRVQNIKISNILKIANKISFHIDMFKSEKKKHKFEDLFFMVAHSRFMGF